MTDEHRCEWVSQDTDDPAAMWVCTECTETCAPCVIPDQRRGPHPTESNAVACARCRRVEEYVLNDITDALTLWDERDRHPGRSPMAFSLTRVSGSQSRSLEVRYPEDVRHMLLGWAIRWAAHTGAAEPGQESADYLRSRIFWAVHNPTASHWEEYRQDVRQIRAHARRVVGLAPLTHPEACMHCGGRIVQDRADEKWRPLDHGLSDAVRCTGCGLTWGDRSRFQLNVWHHIWELPAKHPDRWVSLAQAVEIFPDVPRSTFRDWLHRDRRRHRKSLERLAQWEAAAAAWYAEGFVGPLQEPPAVEGRQIRELPERLARWEAEGRAWYAQGFVGPLPSPPDVDQSRPSDVRYRLGDLAAAAEHRSSRTRRGRPARAKARSSVAGGLGRGVHMPTIPTTERSGDHG